MSDTGYPKLGDVIVICPGCGTPLEAGVYLDAVRFKYSAVYVDFSGIRIDHDCEGSHP